MASQPAANCRATGAAEESLDLVQLPSLWGRLPEVRSDAERSPHPIPRTGISGLNPARKFSDCQGKQLRLAGAVENGKERRAPLEEGTLATGRNLISALAYSQDRGHGPKPLRG